MMKQLTDVKKEYRALFNEVRTMKGASSGGRDRRG